MEEQLISQKLAKLAIKKGCNLPIYGKGYEYSDRDGNVFWTNTEFGISGKEKTKPVIVMTQSLLQKWIMKNHNILINVFPLCKADLSVEYHCKIHFIIDGIWEYTYPSKGLIMSYEQCLEKALETSLNKIKHNAK
jgi:hypothetical protein